MKKVLLTISSICLLAMSIPAQDLLLDPQVVQAAFNFVDLSDNDVDLPTEVHVTNNTAAQMELQWFREVPADCPAAWQTQICDNNFCYGYSVSSNINPSQGLMDAFVLDANETFEDFALHVWPRQTAGCCQIKVHFARVSAPDEILGTLYFDVSVNTSNCSFPTSAEEKLEAESISVYPNPTTGQFTLTNNDVVKRVVVFNILGKQMKSFNYVNGDYFDISDLADGLYLVGMKNSQGETLKTLRVSKRGLRP